jgi:hypothetical protein
VSADEAPLIFSRKLGMLAPANQAASEALRAIDGNVVVKITRANRNQARRSLYWSVASVVAKALSDLHDMVLTENDLHDLTRRKLGLFHTLVLPSGDVHYKLRSTADKHMAEPERAAYTDKAFNVWAAWLAIDVDTLVREGQNG